MGAGRPTDYDKKYCDELLEYFDVEPYEERIIKKVTKSGDVIEIPEDVASDTPTLAGFARRIGVHRDTLHEWAKTHEEFSDAIKRAKTIQEDFLVVNGNKGLINTAFGIFVTKNLQGYRDKQPGEEDRTIKHEYTNKSDEELDQELEAIEAGDE